MAQGFTSGGTSSTGGATELDNLTDVSSVSYTDGKVLRADGTDYKSAVLGHGDLSDIGTTSHTDIDTAVSASTSHIAAAAPHSGHVDTTGNETIAGVKTFSSIPVLPSSTPTADNEATRKAYVDAIATGLELKNSCRVATTAAGTLASDFENGDTIDGVTLATGDRILIKDQVDKTTNGIYTVNASGAPTRATDYDASAEVQEGTFTFITSGTANANKQFAQITIDPTLGSSDLEFTQIGGQQAYTASNGVLLSTNDFQIDLSDTNPSLEVTDGGLRAKVVTNGGLERTSDGLQIQAAKVTNAMLAGSIDLTAKVTGALPVANGGTGQTTLTKGDILVASNSSTLTKLGVGSNDQVLTADSAAATGVKWAAASGGGGAVYGDASDIVVVLSADRSTTGTTSLTDITGLSFTAAANTTYIIDAYLIWRSTATTTGIGFSINGPSGATSSVYRKEIPTSLTAQTEQYSRAYNASQVTTAIDAANVDNFASITGIIRNGATEGTVILRFRSETTNVVTVKAGSVLKYRKAVDGGGGATLTAQYVTLATDSVLPNERVLTAGSGISITDGGAGSTVTIAATGGGGTPAGNDGDIQINDNDSFGALTPQVVAESDVTISNQTAVSTFDANAAELGEVADLAAQNSAKIDAVIYALQQLNIFSAS